MTLQASGAISLGNVSSELGVGSTTARSMNDSSSRTLAGVASGQISMSSFYGKSNFTPTTRIYSVFQSFATTGTETVPSGATSVTIEVWGAGGPGGQPYYDGSQYDSGGGGGGGSYCRSVYSVSGGDTLAYSAAGYDSVNCTVSSGSKTITTLVGKRGAAGSSASYGVPGTAGGGYGATGGNVVNQTGNSASGGTPGSAITGLSSAAYGDGGSGDNIGSTTPGSQGAVIFRYT